MILFFISSGLAIAQPEYLWVLRQSGSSLGGPVDYNIFNPDIVYYGSNNIIYKSTNRGETFFATGTQVPNSSKIKCIMLDSHNPGTFVVAIESSPNDKIYKTTNDGSTWILTNDEGQMSYFGIPVTKDPSNPNVLYTMVNTNFKRSTDFGSTWVTIASNFGPISAPCDIEVFPDTSIILIGDNGTGIFKSTNYGLTWSQKFSTSGEIPTISIDYTNPGVAWATKWGGGGGFLKSTDYGETWVHQSLFNGINMWGVHVQPTNGNNIVTGCYSCGNTWRSTDRGESWRVIPISSANYQVTIVDSMTQFAAQGNGFYKLQSPYFNPFEVTSFTALIEGYFNGNTMTTDTVTLELRNQFFPYNKIDQTKILLDQNGNGNGKFYNAANNTPFYIVVKHRNALETWSSFPQSFSANSLAYDFTSSASQAYGNNLKLINGKWCIFGGDVNQDGFIESDDVNLVYTANVFGVTGNSLTDLNGDSFTEIDDLNIVFINNVLGIERKAPPGFSRKLNFNLLRNH